VRQVETRQAICEGRLPLLFSSRLNHNPLRPLAVQIDFYIGLS
jgi:hypothetical protein